MDKVNEILEQLVARHGTARFNQAKQQLLNAVKECLPEGCSSCRKVRDEAIKKLFEEK